MIDTPDYPLSDSPKKKKIITDNLFLMDFWRWFTYLTLLSLGGGISYTWYFVTEKLNPLIEESLSHYLSRPVKLGEIEYISPNAIKLGKSILETTPTENDCAIVEEIILNYNLLKLLSRQIDLDINLNQSKIYLQQNQDNSWLHLHLNNQKKTLPWGLKINVKEIKINNSHLFVKNNFHPQNHTQLNITSANITLEENKNLFNLQGKTLSGGEINLTGFNIPNHNQWKLNINANNIVTETINQINLVKLPLQIKSGKLNTNLSLEFKNDTLNHIQGKINPHQIDVSFPKLAYTLTKTKGEIEINNQEIKLNNIQTNLGLIQANLKGVINQKKELNIDADINQPLTINNVITSLKLPAINLKTEGKIKGNLKIIGNINKPIIQANITNAEKEIKLDKIPINQMKTNLTITNSQVNIDDFTISPQIGGKINGIGFINLKKSNSQFHLNLQGKNIDGEKLLNLYQQTLPIPLRKINGNYNLSGNWQDWQNFQLTGVSHVTLPQGEAKVKNLQLNQDSWLAEIQINKVGLKNISFIDCEKLKCQDSLLDGEFNLQGKTHNITQENLKLKGNFAFNLKQNQVTLKDTLIENNHWQTRLEIHNFPLPQLASFSHSQNRDNQENKFLKGIDKGKITAGLTIRGDLQNRQDIKIKGEGKINLPQGEVQVTEVKVEKDNFIAKTVTDGFSLSQINNLSGEAKGDVTIEGNLNSLHPKSINVAGNLLLTQGIGLISQPMKVSFDWNGKYLRLNQAVSNNLQARGIINLDTQTQQIKNFDLDVLTQEMSLSQLSLPFSPNLLNYQGDFNFQGKLTGNLSQPQLTGNVTLNQLEIANLNFSPLQGSFSFSPQQGLELALNGSNEKDKLALKVDGQFQPLSLDLQTDKTRLIGLREGNNFQINFQEIPLEKVTQSWQKYFPPEIKQLGGILSGEINLNLDSYDITASSLTIFQPSLNHLRGDFLTSELTMTDEGIKFINGNLQHQKNEYQFQGELVFLEGNPQLQLAIEIKDGEIENLLSSWEFFQFSDISQGFQPRKYASAKDLYSTTGKDIKDNGEDRQGKIISLSHSFPRGENNKQNRVSVNSGQNQVNSIPDKQNYNLSLASERKTSLMTDEDSHQDRQKTTVERQESVSVNSVPNPVNDIADQQNYNLSLASEKETSLMTEGEIREGKESDKGEDVSHFPLFSIDSDSNSLWETLNIFQTVENNLKLIQRKNANGNLPSLEDLKGRFRGMINVGFSSEKGVKAEFDFRGNSWQWGTYNGNFLQITGSYSNQLLTFLPVIIQSDDSILSLTGTFQPDRISGEVTLSNFPFSQLANILSLPDGLKLEGNINSSIAISGSEVNPLAKGNIEVVDARINDNVIDKTSASFGFRNSRLDFLASSNLLNNEESLRLIGSIPFQLFPNSLVADNQLFNLDINLTRNGFNLLDIISNNQLNWLGGEGNINLNIQGLYYQNNNEIRDINAQGVININNGNIKGDLINNQLISNINGQVLFDFSQVNIPNLTGDFNGAGILLSGSLPLINSSSLPNQFLTLNIDNLSLNLDSFYQGNASANLNIYGSAIAPYLGGEIDLFDGKFKLSNNSQNNWQNKNKMLNKIKIDSLKVKLGNNITIEQAPILNLKAEGNLKLQGSLNNLKPEGIIRLKGGTINLFTSQLNLANNYNNTAKFIPENGFNPYIDLQLQGSVTETSRYQFVETSNPNEIKDFGKFSLNTAQTVRVKAQIKGWSNNLENNIILSSSPQRNETEIIALLGGGFFNNLTEGNGNMDLANLASAAFLGGVQGEIQKVLGFDELRLFPTQILDTENRTSTLGLGAELALDLTNNFSVSVMKILTNEQAPRYSVRYRLNEQTIFRGSSDFQQDTRGVLEFEHRF